MDAGEMIVERNEATGVSAETGGHSDAEADMKALTEAFNLFTHTTASMEESYHRLETRIQSLDRELQEKNQELELTTEHLNSILDSMSDGVIAVGTDGTITTFNHAATDVLGFSQQEAIGRLYGELFGHARSSAPGRLVTELRAKDGKVVPVNEKCSEMSDRGGNRIGTLYVFQDLREIEALRKEVRHKDRLAAIGQMAATVAHEIRNPLGGIRGFAALLERDIDKDDPRHRLVQKILSGTRSLDGVVNELLEYTRPVELVLRPENCRDLVEAAIGYLGLEGGGVDVRNEVDPAASVKADSHKIRQALLNILLNAVQSIEGEGRVTVTSESDEEMVTITIADTGCGIEVEDLDKVFSPFFTTKEKGTGLGLALAAKTVESHGGSLETTSTPGEGSAFHMRLYRTEH